MSSPLEIETVTSLSGTHAAIEVFQSAWGRGVVLDTDTYFAAAAHGSYLSVGRIEGEAVVAAFGFLSHDPLTGGLGLHSHMAAVTAGNAGKGLGAAIKFHQREWARSRGITAITWTYDPLQANNAWFNLIRLGAEVVAFHPNFYGVLRDEINGDEETDRFEVRWLVEPDNSLPVPPTVPKPGQRLVLIPTDIGALRRSDPDAARAVQLAMRASLQGVVDGTERVVGISAEGNYVLETIQ